MKLTNIAIALLLLSIEAFASQPIRIACIGDSITYGSGIEDRDKDGYPAVLQRMLGSGYDVRNYGISARVMTRNGDYPFMDEQAYADARAFLPDIVTIMLGTNDSKPHNWTWDGVHPTYAGHRRMSELWIRTAGRKLLK